jgi:hypothetical protein
VRHLGVEQGCQMCSFGTFWCHVPRKIWQPWCGDGKPVENGLV